MQKKVENTGIFDVLVLPQPVVDLDQEGINVFTIPEIRGMIARFLKQIFFLNNFHLTWSPQCR